MCFNISVNNNITFQSLFIISYISSKNKCLCIIIIFNQMNKLQLNGTNLILL